MSMIFHGEVMTTRGTAVAHSHKEPLMREEEMKEEREDRPVTEEDEEEEAENLCTYI